MTCRLPDALCATGVKMDTRQGRAGFSRGLVAFQSRSGGLGIVGQLPPVRGGADSRAAPAGCPTQVGCVRQRGPFRSTCGTSLRKARLELETRNSRGGRRGRPRRDRPARAFVEVGRRAPNGRVLDGGVRARSRRWFNAAVPDDQILASSVTCGGSERAISPGTASTCPRTPAWASGRDPRGGGRRGSPGRGLRGAPGPGRG